MSRGRSVERRGFVKVCAAVAMAVGADPRRLAASGGAARLYNRVRLVDGHGNGITPENVAARETYVFNYPYVTTPCFLLNLGRPVTPDGDLHTERGETYAWPGGIGPGRSIVSFAAICAHKMSHPARSVSFIDYRPERVRFRDSAERMRERERVIFCCSEKSVYDPGAGARVLGGPAKQPLAAILLQIGDGGALYALGTAGGEMYAKYFERFGFRLAVEYRTRDVERPVVDTTEVRTIEAYSANLVRC